MRISLNKKSPRVCVLNPEALLPLEWLRPGEWAEVVEVTGEPHWVARMAELGVRVEHCLLMLQPGSPCLVQIDGGRLSIRGDLAMQIMVRPIPSPLP